MTGRCLGDSATSWISEISRISSSLGRIAIGTGLPYKALGPGLTESLAFMWTLPETALQPGQSVNLRVWKKKYTQLMVTYGGKEWTDDLFHYGQTTVPVAS